MQRGEDVGDSYRAGWVSLTAYADCQNSPEDLWDADGGWGPWGLGVMIGRRMVMHSLASGQFEYRREHCWACRRGIMDHARGGIPQHSNVIWPVRGGGFLFHLDDFVDD